MVQVIACLILPSCKKEKPAAVIEVPPADPYTYSADLQSSKDAVFAYYLVSDIDMMCSFMGEKIIANSFYTHSPTTSGNTVTVTYDEMSSMCVTSFNNSKCVDGRTRSGTVFMQFPNPPGAPAPGPKLTHDFAYEGKISFSEYVVDGWKVLLADESKPLLLINTLPAFDWNPSATKITWKLSGSLRFIKQLDTITWNGIITKTLDNTNDANVFNPDKKSAIKWNLAKVSYGGTVSGFMPGHVPYILSIDESKPVTRDFTCSPAISSANGAAQFHPFISGLSTFTVGSYHPRTINYGPEGACDNNGVISFKEENHDVEFNK